MKILLVCLGVFLLNFGAISQNIDIKSSWYGPSGFLYLSKQNNNILYFEGGDLHEGGLELTLLKILKTNCYKVIKNPGDYDHYFIKINQLVCFEKINNHDIIVVYDENGEMTHYFKNLKETEDNSKQYILTKINCELAGEYTDIKTNKKYTFYPNCQKATGFGSKTTYEFANDYATYVDAFSFDGKLFYYYEKVFPDGLNLYEATVDENNYLINTDGTDWFEKEKSKLIFQLHNKQPINTSSNLQISGMYTFASSEIILYEPLFLSTAEMRLARNEIFARHGYRFKSDDLKQYFEKQSWYKPLFENVDEKLTEIEKFNIKVLQSYEKEK